MNSGRKSDAPGLDAGGTSAKVLASGQSESRSFRSGPTLISNRWSPESISWSPTSRTT
jgi:hypothetical protein